MLEHVQDRGIEVMASGSRQRDLNLRAAGTLRLNQQRVQKGSTRIGVHLDQLGSIPGEMKVITHEHAKRAMVATRELRSPGQDRIPIAGQSR